MAEHTGPLKWWHAMPRSVEWPELPQRERQVPSPERTQPPPAQVPITPTTVEPYRPRMTPKETK